jgi:hypothetical protein
VHQIDGIVVSDEGVKRNLSFWLGNPAEITRDDPVDLIVVSAFPNDYTPTPSSIIGALYGKGVSVEALARDKAVDLRETAGFWLSRRLRENATPVGAGQVLCFEPDFLGSRPAEVVGSLFRGLFPFLPEGKRPEARIAMAVISTGARGESPERMLRALVSAAAAWMKRGLPIGELRIMERDPARAGALAPVFAELKGSPQPGPREPNAEGYDLFLSFAEEDANAVDIVRQALSASTPAPRVFDYRSSVDPGKVWQDAIEAAMTSCRKAVAFISPAYFKSVDCKEEINMARLRHKRENQSFLFPLYVRSLEHEAELPLWLQTVTYLDCRTPGGIDATKLRAAADRLSAG